jgi:glycosyltransferase involved in cell wall biosynthesis
MLFSVIVPTYNRLESLKRTIDSLVELDFRDYELIIVNDGSTDGTDNYLGCLSSEAKIHFLNQTNLGPAAARNAGLSEASGQYIAYTDDDCVVPRHWLRRFHQVFEEKGADILGGVVKNCVKNNQYSEISQEITNHFVRTLGGDGRSTPFLTSNNIAYRATAIRGAGGFDDRFRVAGGEERALNSRIIAGAGLSLLLSDLVVEHYHTLGARGFIRQQLNYGRGSYLLHRLVGRESGLDPGMIPMRAYGTLMMSFLRSGLILSIKSASLFILGQISALVGFTLQSLNPPGVRRAYLDGQSSANEANARR